MLLQVSVKVGTTYLPMSITVMEKGPDFLFGLDMLRRYQCNIDLKTNKLRFHVEPEEALPFLSEHELPESVRFEMQGEPEAGGCLLAHVPFLCSDLASRSPFFSFSRSVARILHYISPLSGHEDA